MIEYRRLLLMYKEIWDERPHRSEVSGKRLGKTILTTFFHHILPKSVYKSAKFAKDNIILLTSQEHDDVENGYKSFPEIERRKKILLEKYGKD